MLFAARAENCQLRQNRIPPETPRSRQAMAIHTPGRTRDPGGDGVEAPGPGFLLRELTVIDVMVVTRMLGGLTSSGDPDGSRVRSG